MKTVTYEITATVEFAFRAKFERFMIERHIPDLMATGCFGEASFSRSEPGRYRTRYEAIDREAMERYLVDHAPRLRVHTMETFPIGVVFEREEWVMLARFP